MQVKVNTPCFFLVLLYVLLNYIFLKLANYIADLLYRYECVIVPGFGGFVSNNRSARIDTFSNTFYPPYKQISFNSQLSSNDGLLTNYISNSENLGYESALNYIKFEVEEWNKKLKFQDLELEGLGALSLENDKLLFEPSDKVNYLTSSFGLTNFVSPEIKREMYREQVIALEEKAPVYFTEERKKAPNYLKYAAIFVIGISSLALAGKFYQDYRNSQAASVMQAEQNVIQQKIEKATFEIAKPLPAVQLEITAPKKNFHVIAGAFRIPENADRIVVKLKEEGYDARILGVNKWGLSVVSFNSYLTKEESEAGLEQIQQDKEKDAWILFQEL
jgi:hypothetical protein